MSTAVAAVLAPAVGTALSPVPMIAIILVLFGPRARVTGPVFLAGWVVALTVLCGAAFLVARAGHAATDETTSDGIGWGRVVAGLLFLVLAVRKWRSQPADGDAEGMPAWTAGVDSAGPGRVLGLAVLAAGANPKNVVLALAAGSGLATVGPSTAEAWAAIAAFVVVGSLSVAAPVSFFLAAPERATAVLDSAKLWLGVHGSAVLVVVLVVLVVGLVAGGLDLLGS